MSRWNAFRGLALVTRLEDGITGLLARGDYMAAADAATLARVVTAITNISRCRAFLHLQMNMLKGQYRNGHQIPRMSPST